MKKEGSSPSKQDYKYIGVLYPDSESYNCSLVCSLIKSYFQKWAFIVHDEDIDQNGELKKAHLHWYGACLTGAGKSSPRLLSSVATALGLRENEIEYAKSEKSSIRYLVHADDEDKAQYPISRIDANFSLLKFFKDKASMMKSKKIYDYICNERPASLVILTDWVFRNGLYAEFRRGFAIWDSLIREVRCWGCSGEEGSSNG